MCFPRRRLLPVVLAGVLFAPAAYAAPMPGAESGHASVFQVALPPRTRPRRRLQCVSVRAIAWRRRQARGAAATGRPADGNVRSQLSPNDTSARGPPPFK